MLGLRLAAEMFRLRRGLCALYQKRELARDLGEEHLKPFLLQLPKALDVVCL